jgi:hypothetical protein
MYALGVNTCTNLVYFFFEAGTAATAGYLTQGNTNTLPDVPPPIDREDSLARTDAI